MLGVAAAVWPAFGQFTDPRNYQNAPVDINQLELNYAYVRANSSIDPAIIIAGAKLNLNQGVISYTRYFSLFHRLAWLSPAIPIGGLNGSISGTTVNRSISGAGDTSYEAAILLKGGPALSVPDFENYLPETSVGVSLIVTAPTGAYRSDRILNLGSNRWSFKPELGLSYPFGPQQKWVLDAYANAYFYTDNTSYRGVQVLSQQPLPGFEGHISYSISENLVASLDTRYSFHGVISLNGIGQNNSQQNFLLGGEAILSLNERNTLTVVVAKALVHENGPSIKGVSVRYDYTWGKGYK